MTNTTIENPSQLDDKPSQQTPETINAENHHHTHSESQAEDNSLSMVRDILFGEQKREHDQRIIDLELLIDNHDQKIRYDMSNDFDILHTEIRLLNQLLSDENKARLDDNIQHQKRFKEISQQHLVLSENMQKMFTQLSTKMTSEIAALRKEFAQEQQDLMNLFEEEHAKLKKDKADRELLANTFAELAKQLESS
ncbi:MAG: Unknown protein [uncultured Thiotrichaceae bacterium]|uniref:Uncharacterized protein n=1 Tax=uncultured Thiotrichaceae bacterium TaxID=298394 RepID=A0A6S6T9T3_9GAMM|nr:MAG: Unknown protein [uncultured Thiotrichaceae bacterium]